MDHFQVQCPVIALTRITSMLCVVCRSLWPSFYSTNMHVCSDVTNKTQCPNISTIHTQPKVQCEKPVAVNLPMRNRNLIIQKTFLGKITPLIPDFSTRRPTNETMFPTLKGY